MDFNKETALCETILFLESEPVTLKGLASKAQLSEDVTEKCLENLKEKYTAENSGIELATPERQKTQGRQELSTGIPEPLMYRRSLENQSLQNAEKRFFRTGYDIGFPRSG